MGIHLVPKIRNISLIIISSLSYMPTMQQFDFFNDLPRVNDSYTFPLFFMLEYDTSQGTGSYCLCCTCLHSSLTSELSYFGLPMGNIDQ